MRALLFILLSARLASAAGFAFYGSDQAFNPAMVPGCVLWVDMNRVASNHNDVITNLVDLSSRHIAMTNVNGTCRYYANQVNGRPTLYMVNSQPYVTSEFTGITITNFQCFGVANMLYGVGQWGRLFTMNSGATADYSSGYGVPILRDNFNAAIAQYMSGAPRGSTTILTNGTYYLMQSELAGADSCSIYTNNGTAATGTGGTAGSYDHFRIGGELPTVTSGYWLGHMAELAFYTNSAASSGNGCRATLKEYFRRRYNLW